MSQDRIDELIDEFRSTESGPIKIALIEEAIRLSDALNDTPQSYSLRDHLVHVATFSGHKEKALVAFAWCLAEFDKNPDQYNAWQLLWQYKWILGGITDFPKVSKTQIVSMQGDFERRLQQLNFGLGPANYLRWKNLMAMGEHEQALEYYAKWQDSQHDALGDCAACVANSEADLMMQLQRNEKALQFAEPILSGRLSCASVPQSTYGHVMRALLRLERLDEAEEILQKARRPLSKNGEYLNELAELQLYLIRQRSLVKAVNTAEKCLPWAADTTDLDARYWFYWSTHLLLRALLEKGKQKRKFKLPQTLSCYREDSEYDLAELADWFEQETRAIVDAFDTRNGNNYCTQLIEESRELAKV